MSSIPRVNSFCFTLTVMPPNLMLGTVPEFGKTHSITDASLGEQMSSEPSSERCRWICNQNAEIHGATANDAPFQTGLLRGSRAIFCYMVFVMDGEFGLVESFGVDDGELDGKTPQECFVLGYEMAQVCHEVDSDPEEINKTVHADNIDRITAAMKKREREFQFMWPSDDVAESWVYLKILPSM